jgi:hypothetical protein
MCGDWHESLNGQLPVGVKFYLADREGLLSYFISWVGQYAGCIEDSNRSDCSLCRIDHPSDPFGEAELEE